MENMVFLIDLPRLDKGADHESTLFSQELERFLRSMGVEDKMVDSLASYNFSKTAGLGFVYTRPGGHRDGSFERIGYCGLGSTVTALGLATTDPVEVDLACASLGAIKYSLIESIYNACQGDGGMKEYLARINRKPGVNHSGSLGAYQLLKDRFRIYFPTNRTVRDSRGGEAAGGTICLQSRWWHSPDFPTELGPSG
ncbi:hypothetical protein CDD83_2444 [Cordyceps sp. RAO-2017]|nr:hypothetical protein CDD83_2444 [Cordyceps sp. RAO-2017]